MEDTFGHQPNQEGLRAHQIHKDKNGRIWINSFTGISTLTPRPGGGYEWNRMRYKKVEGNVESEWSGWSERTMKEYTGLWVAN